MIAVALRCHNSNRSGGGSRGILQGLILPTFWGFVADNTCGAESLHFRLYTTVYSKPGIAGTCNLWISFSFFLLFVISSNFYLTILAELLPFSPFKKILAEFFVSRESFDFVKVAAFVVLFRRFIPTKLKPSQRERLLKVLSGNCWSNHKAPDAWLILLHKSPHK